MARPSFKQYLQEGIGTDLMLRTAEQIHGSFRWAKMCGYYEAEDEDNDLWDARLIVFVGETDPQIIHNGLIALGYSYEETIDPDTGESFSGYIRGFTDVIVEKSTAILSNGAVMNGYDLGIYAEQQDVLDLGFTNAEFNDEYTQDDLGESK